MSNNQSDFRFLLHGIDTIEVSYYLDAVQGYEGLDFTSLLAKRDALKASKGRFYASVQLGCENFLLSNHGTNTGHSLFMENEFFEVALGEFIRPNFYVKFRCGRLWHEGIDALHARFLAWADSIGMYPSRRELVSRVDLAFDYQIPHVDFDLENFVSSADADKLYRRYGKNQTFDFGAGDVKLRVYNKSDEIRDKSGKVWFYKLWDNVTENVWRIEWQLRKEGLRPIGIKTLNDLKERQGDLLLNLATSHTSLRIKGETNDRKAWALHPLWSDYLDRVARLPALGVVRDYDPDIVLDERLLRCLISMYGYMKRIAAIQCVKRDLESVDLGVALLFMREKLFKLHDRIVWEDGVKQRAQQMRFGHE
jgi:hypothetical protein